MRESRIVLLERDDQARELYTTVLVSEGYRVRAEALFDDVLAALEKGGVPVVVAGIAPGGATVAQIADAIRRVSPATALVALLGREAAEGTLRAVRDGALEALTKPVGGEALALAVRRCVETVALLERHGEMRRHVQVYQSARRMQRAPDAATAAERLLDFGLSTTGAECGLVFRPPPAGVEPAAPVEIGAARGLDEATARELLAAIDVRALAATPAAAAHHPPSSPPLQPLKGRLARLATELVTVRVGPPEAPSLVAALLLGARAAAAAAARDERARAAALAELELVASQAEFAIGLAERYADGANEPSIDPLTDLYDARYLSQIIASEAKRAKKSGIRFAVLAIELDQIEELGEAHGAIVGGQVLVEASRLLSRAVRDVDIVARTGPGAFGVVLLATDAGGASRAAERIRAAFERHRFLAREGLDLGLSVSVGVALYPEHGETAPALLGGAGQAARSAKAGSRNAVVMASPPPRRGARG